MNTNDSTPSPEPPGDPPPRQHLSARVPEHVSRGVFSTGVLVMTGGTEFVLDFIQNLGQPAQIAARVIMPHATMPQFIQALRTNLDLYQNRFGPPPSLPKVPQPERKPTVQEIYDDLKITDDVLTGAYANGVMIGHAASEFKFDFLSNLLPHAAVSCRVYLTAPHVPRFLESLDKTYQELVRRMQPPPPPAEGAPGS